MSPSNVPLLHSLFSSFLRDSFLVSIVSLHISHDQYSLKHKVVIFSNFCHHITCNHLTQFSLYRTFLTDSLGDYCHVCVMWLFQLQFDRNSNWRFGSVSPVTTTRLGHGCLTCTGCGYSCLLDDGMRCRWDL